MRPTSCSTLLAQLLVAGNLFPAGHRDLDQHGVADRRSGPPEPFVERLEAQVDTLGVVEAVDAEDELAAAAELLAQLLGALDHARLTRGALEAFDVDRDREGAGAHAPSFVDQAVRFALRAHQACRHGEEVAARCARLEADHVGAEQTLDHFLAPG